MNIAWILTFFLQHIFSAIKFYIILLSFYWSWGSYIWNPIFHWQNKNGHHSKAHLFSKTNGGLLWRFGNDGYKCIQFQILENSFRKQNSSTCNVQLDINIFLWHGHSKIINSLRWKCTFSSFWSTWHSILSCETFIHRLNKTARALFISYFSWRFILWGENAPLLVLYNPLRPSDLAFDQSKNWKTIIHRFKQSNMCNCALWT